MTAANFCIVLSEALAPSAIAAELLKQLPTYAPNLLRYLDSCQSQFVHYQPDQTRCTALEAWQIEQAGFPLETAKHNAALALLLAAQTEKTNQLPNKAPFWLVELVHLAPSREGAALIPASELDIDATHSHDLLQAAQALCEGTPFELYPWSTTHWLLTTHTPLPPVFASPQLVSRSAVNDWWDQDPRTKEWRRFVNELQMLYFDHPINQQRQNQQLPPINSLWPLGGLSSDQWQPQPLATLCINDLTQAYLRQDWGLWLQQLQHIDQKLPELLSQKPHIILSNTEQLLHAYPRPTRFWHRFVQPSSTWRSHWLAQS